jgi:hypothetical protein
MWYSLRDGPTADASWLRQGLRRTSAEDSDAGPKPSWDAYTALSGPAELLYLPGLYDLSVERIGSGAGTVTSSPTGIDCGAACSGTYAAGSIVTLSASPASGSSFAGWGGDCSGAGACTLTMSAARSVQAEFEAVSETTPTPTTAGVTTTNDTTPTAELGSNAATPSDGIAPAITRLGLSPPAFHAARSGPALAAAVGARVSMTVSEPATVTFRVSRYVAGQQRWVLLRGRIARSLPAGANALRYRGRISGRTLRPGRYRLLVRARDAAGNLSSQRRTTFVVLR